MPKVKDPRRGLSSASSMYRVAECPGSLALIETIRDYGWQYRERYDPARESGVRIHTWLAAKTLERPEPDLNPGDVGTAEKCDELKAALVAQWLREPADLETIIERRFWFRIGLWPRFSGQPDYVLINRFDNRALILDYKTGRIEAEPAADNLQLRTEVALLKHNFGYLDEISCAIIEPNVSWQPDIAVYSSEDIARATDEILEIVANTQWHPSERKAGNWCVHCPAKAHCPEAISYVELLPALRESQTVAELPRGDRGVTFWERIKVAKKLIEELEQAYVTILETEPDALPGYVLPKHGRERRFVTLPARLKTALAEYLTGDEIDGCATFHLSKLEELVGLKKHVNGVELKRLFANITRNAVATTHDNPFIRPMTKKERAMIGYHDTATPKVQLP